MNEVKREKKTDLFSFEEGLIVGIRLAGGLDFEDDRPHWVFKISHINGFSKVVIRTKCSSKT